MGIYLGQLPPAEIARLKAELAETLIANFCYPRFFDHRTESLQMRPVDRAKRQEVWLYLSSVDFTAWNRIDLTAADFQNHIESLFIQFVQRNRSFFGEQGRRRMSDIRMLISTCATSVAQRLRSYLTGQKPTNPPFGSPRPMVSWAVPAISGKPEITWEKISTSTMTLQQQLQEVRGEIKPAAAFEGRTASAANGTPRRPTRPQPVASAGITENNNNISHQPTMPTTPLRQRMTPGSMPVPDSKKLPVSVPAAAATATSTHQSGSLMQPVAESQLLDRRQSGPLTRQVEPVTAGSASATKAPAKAASPVQAPVKTASGGNGAFSFADSSAPTAARSLPHAAQTGAASNGIAASSGSREMMTVGEDDIAIFEQMRHQLLIWLRVEAVKAGVDIANQSPVQLLDLLRQQSRQDETRLQVVSTLLNLSNQVIKTGLITILDYKQALMFHLMHTRQ